ncbi:MAG TPA: dihydrolipoyl dehydrogenase [Candidatus Lokiarchaeia archaeon]|nr:dihydrolipoyl dehydrogenase [Candidatus Lokiarchaeia archaeon]
MENTDYDIVVIGSGPGGYHSALRAAQFKARVAIIEKKAIGGACTHSGCISIKCLDVTAKLFEDFRKKAETFGARIEGPITFDFATAVQRKDRIVAESAAGIEQLLKLAKVKIFKGHGYIEDGNATDGFIISCLEPSGNKIMIHAKRVIIATGSIPMEIPMMSIDHEHVLTSDDVLKRGFDQLPRSMIIIGAGVIGCEFANIFARFGVEVTVIELSSTMLRTEEKLISKELKKKFDLLGIKVHFNQFLYKIERLPEEIRIITFQIERPGRDREVQGKKTFTAEICLFSVGRERQSSNLGLEKLGVMIKLGRIIVNNDTCETDVKGIYAVGDVSSNMMLAQLAFYESDIAIANALASIGTFNAKPRSADYFVIPYSIYTNPIIASVGMRETEAKKLYNVRTGRFYYKNDGMARCMGEDEGFMMIVANQENDKILGASCIGYAAPELISEIAVAMYHNITVKKFVKVIHSHPTFSEMVLETAEDVHGMAIHKIGKRI